jgi:tetratricopeptide (TPR) repeat protein
MQSSPRIEELRQKFHENPRRYFAPLANEYRKAGDPEQAIAICRAHLAQQPAHMSGHVVYGQALYDAHRIDEAREVFQLALALDPENIIVLRHLGDIARQRGEVEEARSWYSRALDGDPHDAEVAAYLAELTEPLVSRGVESEPAMPTADTGQPASSTITPPADSAEPVEPVEPTEPVEPVEFEESPYLEPEEVATAAAAAEPVAESVPEPPAEFVAEPVAEFVAEPVAEFVVEPVAESVSEPEADFVAESIEEPVQEPVEEPVAEPMEGFVVESASELADAVADEPVPEVSPQPAARSSRPTPTSENFPIVTRTLAELYLQQGHIEAALDIYRQLAAHEPDDADLRARLAELLPEESPLSLRDLEWTELEAEGVVTGAADAGQPSPEDRSPGAQSSDRLWDTADFWGTGFFEDTDEADEIFGLSDDSLSSAAGPTEQGDTVVEAEEPVTQPEPAVAARTEAPAVDETTTEPLPLVEDETESFGLTDEFMSANLAAAAYFEESSPDDESPYRAERVEELVGEEAEPAHADITPAEPAPAKPAPRELTVREFFATLGSIRPPSAGAAGGDTADQSQPSESAAVETPAEEAYRFADDAFANLFADSPVSAEDSRAAAALSGAVAHGVPFATQSHATPTAPRETPAPRGAEQTARESEEDIRRFREWLDGLAES